MPPPAYMLSGASQTWLANFFAMRRRKIAPHGYPALS
jgi:hypothetical protein